MKKIAILQSNYIPWKGYFDIINYVDEFIIYDEAQYTRRDWRNRNLIKSRYGLKWLTIPVEVKGKYNQTIRETKIADRSWAEKHWESIRHNYHEADYFDEYKLQFESTYKKATELDFLSEVNLLFIDFINRILHIKTKISQSTQYHLKGNRNEKIISICEQSGASSYVTGPAARQYINEDLFKKNGIELEYFSYDNYPEYNQLHGSFLHKVSVIDLIFNTGGKAKSYLLSTE